METFRAVVLITIAALYTASRSTSASCVEFCTGQRNGNYQHCSDCNQYVACSNGIKYVMPCPSNLVWDDRKKRCEWTSRTCGTVKPPTTTTKPTSTQYSVVCVESCTGKRNGNYQHCSDCHQYVACSNEIKYIMPCPSNLVWDDVKKRCEWTSRTCGIVKPPTTTTKPTSTKSPVVCVESCTGKRNGNYQHCSDCHQYVACSNEIKYVMPCPSNLVWDDVKKRCEWTSRTCGTVKPPTTTTKPTSTIYPVVCVESCTGKRNGNYQHCSDCNQYVACSNEIKNIMPCPSNLVWDDVKKRCEWTSRTCGTVKPPITTTKPTSTIYPVVCVESCTGKRNGNYQHCSDCHQYVACSNEIKYVMPCPSNLVWDDVKKRCERTSRTCGTVKPPTTTTKPTSTIYPGCVESCSGQRNGNYQHCSECNQYVACSNGIKYVMPCPSNLVWDDVKKRCEWTSPTCGTTKLPGTNTSLATTFIPGCVQSCAGQPDGNYQHCSDCQQYVACSNGYKYNMPCPSNLVWDDMKKRCEWASQTCGGPR